MNWMIVVSAILAAVTSAVADEPAALGFASYGNSRIGTPNIVIVDAPTARGRGPVEIYLGGTIGPFGPFYWHAVRYSASRQTYEDVFVSENMPGGLAGLAVGNIAGDVGLEIVAALRSGEIRVYDQLSKRARGSFSTGLSDLTALALSDLDGDGVAEVVVASLTSLRIFDGAGEMSWQVPDVGGPDVVVGQMDGDAGLEIAVSSGQVIDVSQRAIQWAHPAAFGVDLEAADIDGDGLEELVASPGWYQVWAYDVEAQLPKWSITTRSDIGAIRLANVDADPAVELLVGEGQSGSVFAFDTVTRQEEWVIHNGGHGGLTEIAIEDSDGDGVVELLWGTSEHLYVAALDTRRIEWLSPRRGFFEGPELGDIDGDGRPELVCGGGRMFVLDPATFAVRAVFPADFGAGWGQVRDLKLRNVDDDAALEVVIATDQLSKGVVRIYDFDGATNTFSERWTNAERPNGSPFHSVEVADLDRDGDLEVIAGGSRSHTGGEGSFVHVFDVRTGLREWHTIHLGSYWSQISAVAVFNDGPGPPQLAALVDRGPIYVFDVVRETLVQVIKGPFSALSRSGSSSDLRSFVVGTPDGRIGRYERGARGYELTWSLALAVAPIQGVHVLAAEEVVAVGQAGRLALYRWHDTVPFWISEDYGSRLGRAVANGQTYLYAASEYAVLAFAVGEPGS